MSNVIANARRLVVKVGSSLVTNQGQGLDHAALSRWAQQIARLRHDGRDVVLVMSFGDLTATCFAMASTNSAPGEDA